MTVRIFIGDNDDLKELSEEYPQEASIIEDMLKASEEDDLVESESSKNTDT